MKHIPKIERDGYMLCSDMNSIPSTKIQAFSYRVGSAERMLAFGEFQIYETCVVEGQLDILLGDLYSYILNRNIIFNTTVYGVVYVDGVITIDSDFNIL